MRVLKPIGLLSVFETVLYNQNCYLNQENEDIPLGFGHQIL